MGYTAGPFTVFFERPLSDFKAGTLVYTSTSLHKIFPLPHIHSSIVSFLLLIMAILARVRGNLKVVLICVSLMAEDVGHILKIVFLFIFLLWRARFFIWVAFLIFYSSLYTLDINFLLVV